MITDPAKTQKDALFEIGFTQNETIFFSWRETLSQQSRLQP